IGIVCPEYDPTSGRDEDLPVDLDHLIPRTVFDFDWRNRGARLEEDATTDDFRWGRSLVGNSLGNYRWLVASENRGRGAGTLAPLPNDGDVVSDLSRWNTLIGDESQPRVWSRTDIAEFQRLVALRTIALCRRVVEDDGIASILRRG